jgi:hypothetical protein
MINLALTEEQATKFRIFIDNYQFFNTLIEAGLDKPTQPQYVLYFNKFGVLKGIESRSLIYEKNLSTV